MAKVRFYYSAMNAGKTTTLLQSAYNYQERGMNVLLYTPLIDNRFEVGVIASRIGLKADAIPFDAAFQFFQHVQQFQHAQEFESSSIQCILIDEAQFLTKSQVQDICMIADRLHIPVLCYGLRTDFLGEPFEGSYYLLSWAEELIEIKTICHCGKKATMNARMDEKGDIVHQGRQIEIGGNERYIALCRKHYYEAFQI